MTPGYVICARCGEAILHTVLPTGCVSYCAIHGLSYIPKLTTVAPSSPLLPRK